MILKTNDFGKKVEKWSAAGALSPDPVVYCSNSKQF